MSVNSCFRYLSVFHLPNTGPVLHFPLIKWWYGYPHAKEIFKMLYVCYSDVVCIMVKCNSLFNEFIVMTDCHGIIASVSVDHLMCSNHSSTVWQVIEYIVLIVFFVNHIVHLTTTCILSLQQYVNMILDCLSKGQSNQQYECICKWCSV